MPLIRTKLWMESSGLKYFMHFTKYIDLVGARFVWNMNIHKLKCRQQWQPTSFGRIKCEESVTGDNAQRNYRMKLLYV